MNNGFERIEAGIFVKAIYLLGLASIILSFSGKIPYALLLLSDTGRNPSFLNPVLAVALVITALVVLIFLGKRFIDIVRGKVTLSALTSSAWSVVLRRCGLALLAFGVLVTAFVFGSSFIVRGGGQLLIAGSFGFAIPLGLVLFELSRLSELEAFTSQESA